MGSGSPYSSLLVSLQDRALGSDAVSGHLAFGALVGTDLAYFLLPPGVDLANPAELEILVASEDSDAGTVIERTRPGYIAVVSLAQSTGQRLCVVRLSRPSKFATQPSDSATLAGLTDALTVSGTLVGGLDYMGIPWVDQDDLQLADWLSTINAVEQAQFGKLVRNLGDWDPGQIAWCCFSPNCRPHGPPWELARPLIPGENS